MSVPDLEVPVELLQLLICRASFPPLAFGDEPMFEAVLLITRMWVVGSYARGMLMCGDLDVLLETQTAGKEPNTHRGLARLAFGYVQNLHWHHGTPETNSSRVAFPEAYEVWTPGKDWQAAIGAIPVNPQALRFERPRDLVPLGSHQLYAGIETQDQLLEAYGKGHITWRFLPYEGDGILTNLTRLEEHVLNNFGWGEKTRRLVPHAWAYLRAQHRETDKFTAHAGDFRAATIESFVARLHEQVRISQRKRRAAARKRN